MKSILMSLLVLTAFSLAFAAPEDKPKDLPPVAVTAAVSGFHCQACPDELQKDLGKLDGVTEVKATLNPPVVTAKLDVKKMTPSEFIAAIAKHPQAMDRKKTYGAWLLAYIDTAMCAKQQTMCDGCGPEITKQLKTVEGVDQVAFDPTGKIVRITFKADVKVTLDALKEALGKSKFGFTVDFTSPIKAPAPQKSSTTQHEHHH